MSKKKKNHKKNRNLGKNTNQKKTGVEFFMSEVAPNYIADDIRKDPYNWLEVLTDECAYQLGRDIKLPITEPYAYELFELGNAEEARKIGSDFCHALLCVTDTVRLFCHRNGKRYFSTNLDWDTVYKLFQLVYTSHGFPFHVVTINGDA